MGLYCCNISDKIADVPNSEFKISVRIFVFVVCLMNIIFVHNGNTNLFETCFSNMSSFS